MMYHDFSVYYCYIMDDEFPALCYYLFFAKPHMSHRGNMDFPAIFSLSLSQYVVHHDPTPIYWFRAQEREREI